MYFDFGCAGSWLLCVGFLWHVSWCSSLAAVLRLSCPMAHGNLVPGPRIEPALEGGFLTTGPSGKSLQFLLDLLIWIWGLHDASVQTSHLPTGCDCSVSQGGRSVRWAQLSHWKVFKRILNPGSVTQKPVSPCPYLPAAFLRTEPLGSKWAHVCFLLCNLEMLS